MEKEYLISILKNEIYNQNIPALPDEFNWQEFVEFVMAHALDVIVYMALQKIQTPANEYTERLRRHALKLGYKSAIFDEEAENILSAFEANGICTIPLKGYEIRNLYPKKEMRFMSDFDILIEKEEMTASRKIFADLGFEPMNHSDHHDVFYKKEKALRVEVHKELLTDEKNVHYLDVFNRAKLKSGKKYIYEMSNEDFYVYMLSHMEIHFKDSGLGIRSVLDINIFLDKYDLDRNYVEEELNKRGILGFTRQLEKLARVWFKDERSDEYIQKLGEFIIKCGMFGYQDIWSSLMAVKSYKKGNFFTAKIKGILKTFFLPIDMLSYTYSYLKKAPYLYPIATIQRWFKGIFRLKFGATKSFSVDKNETEVIKEIFEGMDLL